MTLCIIFWSTYRNFESFIRAARTEGRGCYYISIGSDHFTVFKNVTVLDKCRALISPFCVELCWLCRLQNLSVPIFSFFFLLTRGFIAQAAGQTRLEWLAVQVSNLSVGDSPSLLMMLWCSVSSPLEHWFYCIFSHLFSAFWTLFLLFSSTYETLLLLFTSRAPLLLSIFLSGGNPQPDGGGGQLVQDHNWLQPQASMTIRTSDVNSDIFWKLRYSPSTRVIQTWVRFFHITTQDPN